MNTLTFEGTYSKRAADKHFQRALRTYRVIKNALGTTGRAGDVDLHDKSGNLKTYYSKKLTAARAAGRNVGKLSPAMIELWNNMGWTTLFDHR